MLWALIGAAVGFVLLFGAIQLTEDLTEEAIAWIGQRVGVGVLRVLTFGRFPRSPLSVAARFAGTVLGIGIMLAVGIWGLYLWRAA